MTEQAPHHNIEDVGLIRSGEARISDGDMTPAPITEGGIVGGASRRTGAETASDDQEAKAESVVENSEARETGDARPSVGSLATIMGTERARDYLETEAARKRTLAKLALRRRGEPDGPFVRSGASRRRRRGLVTILRTLNSCPKRKAA